MHAKHVFHATTQPQRQYTAGETETSMWIVEDVIKPIAIIEYTKDVGAVDLLDHYYSIVISRFIKRYLKAKRTRAPAYSRALRRIKGGFQRGGQEKLRSDFQSTRREQSSS